MIKVSVIVPTYNREKYIAKAIGILKDQTLKEIEFIIVDDGSKDDTQKILKNEIGKDKRFQLIHYKENKGPSYARNQGLKVAEGEYIGFFDIDDAIPATYYEVLYKEALKNKADICVARSGKNPKSLVEKLSLLRQGSIWDKIYKKEIITINDLKFEEGFFTADTLFTLQAIYYAKTITTTSLVKYDYSLKKDSIGASKKYTEKRKEDIFIIVSKMQAFAKGHGFTPQDKEALNSFIKRCFFNSGYGKNFQKKLSYVLGIREKNSAPKELFSLRLRKFFHVISTASFKEQRAVILFKNSSLFDGEWYLMQYPEARASKLEPEQHYYRIGWKKGFNPSHYFNGNAYLDENSDVKAAGKNPLEHYLSIGQREGRYCTSVDGSVEPRPVENLQLPLKMKSRLKDKIRYALEYPIRVQEEYERLKAEINELEKMNDQKKA